MIINRSKLLGLLELHNIAGKVGLHLVPRLLEPLVQQLLVVLHVHLHHVGHISDTSLEIGKLHTEEELLVSVIISNSGHSGWPIRETF